LPRGASSHPCSEPALKNAQGFSVDHWDLGLMTFVDPVCNLSANNDGATFVRK